MSEPKVSVIIHSYNRYEYLVNALKSIENQTYKNFEIILINDDSDQREYYETNFGPKVKKIDIKKSKTPEWKDLDKHPSILGTMQMENILHCSMMMTYGWIKN